MSVYSVPYRSITETGGSDYTIWECVSTKGSFLPMLVEARRQTTELSCVADLDFRREVLRLFLLIMPWNGIGLSVLLLPVGVTFQELSLVGTGNGGPIATVPSLAG